MIYLVKSLYCATVLAETQDLTKKGEIIVFCTKNGKVIVLPPSLISMEYSGLTLIRESIHPAIEEFPSLIGKKIVGYLTILELQLNARLGIKDEEDASLKVKEDQQKKDLTYQGKTLLLGTVAENKLSEPIYVESILCTDRGNGFVFDEINKLEYFAPTLDRSKLINDGEKYVVGAHHLSKFKYSGAIDSEEELLNFANVVNSDLKSNIAIPQNTKGIIKIR